MGIFVFILILSDDDVGEANQCGLYDTFGHLEDNIDEYICIHNISDFNKNKRPQSERWSIEQRSLSFIMRLST